MRLKNMKKVIGIILALIMVTTITTSVSAKQTLTQVLYFGINEFKDGSNPKMGYAIGQPGSGGAKIWEILKYSDAQYSDPTRLNVYCVKAGVGFSDVTKEQEYNESYNFKTEKSEIVATQDNILVGLVNSDAYYDILGLADLMYLKGITTDAELDNMLEDAEIYKDEYTTIITKQEVEAVQQAALWYFTNYVVDGTDIYNCYDKTAWLNYIDETMGDNYTSLGDYKLAESIGRQKQAQAELLYKHLITEAKENGKKYKVGSMKSSTNITLYVSSSSNNEQPLIEIDREVGKFDLALRKYITKVNGADIEDTKVPVIDKDVLKNETTASYAHRKNPVVIQNGDEVTYNLDIFNEGEVDGYATEIKDQLPTGLKFKELGSNSGFTSSYDETNNTVKITRNKDNVTELKAFDGTTLDKETIEVICTVTIEADEVKAKTLTNIAYISGSYNAKGLEDRDSQTTVSPTNNKDNMDAYRGNSKNKTELDDSNYHYEGEQDDDDFDKLIIMPISKSFDLKLIKKIQQVNGKDVPNRLLGVDLEKLQNETDTTADYDMNKEPVLVKNGDLVTYKLRIYNEGEKAGFAAQISEDIPAGLEFVKENEINKKYAWREEEGLLKTDYLKDTIIDAFDNTTLDYEDILIVLKVVEDKVTNPDDNIKNEAAITGDADENGNPVTDRDSEPENWTRGDDEYQDDEDFDVIKLVRFDLALRKYITEINDEVIKETRVPNIDEKVLDTETTASYAHRKEPIVIKTDDIVTYNLQIFNEGQIDGYAKKIKDQLPTGLEFVKGNTKGYTYEYNKETNLVTIQREENNTDELLAFDGTKLDNEIIEIECKVIAVADKKEKKILTNIASIVEDYNEYGAKDRDSTPDNLKNVSKDNMQNYKGNDKNKAELDDSKYHYEGLEDDDDFEKLVLLPDTRKFDLKLIKHIVEVNGQDVPDRIENIDISKLVEGTKTTADYKLNKEPVPVSDGDLVKYALRVYNEGEKDGYVSEITEDIPDGLEFLGSTTDENMDEITDKELLEAIKFNASYGWNYADENMDKVKTDILAKGKGEDIAKPGSNLIKAFNPEEEYSENNPDYREIYIILKVSQKDTESDIIRNEAAITDDSDEFGDPVDDRDSKPEEWKKYEDDEDYDNIVLKEFDLALRKYITAVSKDENIEKDEYFDNRNPDVKTDNLNTKDANGKDITTATYNHTKEPLLVQKNDYIIYNLTVYNEGELAGYAGEIKDYLPSYLQFVDGEFNKKYDWKVEDRKVSTTYLKDTLLDGFDGKTLDSATVPIMCKVVDTAKTNEEITNMAEITEYLDKNKKEIKDRDSKADNVNIPEDKDLPKYKSDKKGAYIKGQEDDDDFEKIIVKEFNLALRKWVTEAIVTRGDEQTIIQSGNTPEMDPEPPVKVDLNKKEINDVIVKFKYSIRVYNVGDVEGYALEVKDYIPEGLVFKAEDNPDWKEIEEGIITTGKLENTLLKPGEYADVEVLLTWVNDAENLETKVNIAEISKDDNQYDLPDINSTPDNKKEGEDDIDNAPVLLTVITGKGATYFALGFGILAILTSGIVLIKKYVI